MRQQETSRRILLSGRAGERSEWPARALSSGRAKTLRRIAPLGGERKLHGAQIKRRSVLALMAGAAASAWRYSAYAQQPARPVIGVLSSLSPFEAQDSIAAFRQGLREAGFVEGQNVSIAFRWAEGHYDRLPAFAAEFVGLRVSLLFASGGPPAALAAKAATSTIPIVFSAASDPVRLGLVASLNRPGGNITGMSAFATSLAAKRLELIKELLPKARVIGYLLNPNNPNVNIESKTARDAAKVLGIDLEILNASSENDFDAAFAGAVKRRADGMIIAGGEPMFRNSLKRLVGLAAQHAIAAIYGWREFVIAGGLISYGTSLPDSYRRAAIYAGRILKGEKPANLPVMQPTKFHLALNRKTANALGLTLPPALLARADEVIE